MTPLPEMSGAPLRIAHGNMTNVDASKISEVYKINMFLDDIDESCTIAVITGNTYHIVWGIGFDFDNMAIRPKYKWKPSDKGVIFRFNNTKNRELYESKIYYGKNIHKTHESTKNNLTDMSGL